MSPRLRKFSGLFAAATMLMFLVAVISENSFFIALWFFSFPFAFGLMLWDLCTRTGTPEDWNSDEKG